MGRLAPQCCTSKCSALLLRFLQMDTSICSVLGLIMVSFSLRTTQTSWILPPNLKPPGVCALNALDEHSLVRKLSVSCNNHCAFALRNRQQPLRICTAHSPSNNHCVFALHNQQQQLCICTAHSPGNNHCVFLLRN